MVALKYGEDILSVSLYWRARSAINHLARVHYITPRSDRIATVYQDEQFAPSGLTFTRQDEVNALYLPWLPHYPGDLHSAMAGGKLPIAKIPAGTASKPGDESPYAGRAKFYRFHYGPYLLGMNMTAGETFRLSAPTGWTQALDLASGRPVKLNVPPKVGPMSTAVLSVGR